MRTKMQFWDEFLDIFTKDGDVDSSKLLEMDGLKAVEAISEVQHENRAAGCVRIESELADLPDGHAEEVRLMEAMAVPRHVLRLTPRTTGIDEFGLLLPGCVMVDEEWDS
jgi:hypothetical protein